MSIGRLAKANMQHLSQVRLLNQSWKSQTNELIQDQDWWLCVYLYMQVSHWQQGVRVCVWSMNTVCKHAFMYACTYCIAVFVYVNIFMYLVYYLVYCFNKCHQIDNWIEFSLCLCLNTWSVGSWPECSKYLNACFYFVRFCYLPSSCFFFAWFYSHYYVSSFVILSAQLPLTEQDFCNVLIYKSFLFLIFFFNVLPFILVLFCFLHFNIKPVKQNIAILQI